MRSVLRVLPLLLAAAPLAAQTPRLRTDVEAERVRLEAAWRAAPQDAAARRAYATVRYQLGDVWEARELMAPLAASASAPPGDVFLAARLAYLLGDYPGAVSLFERLRKIAGTDSLRTEAVKGLTLSYYQQNRFDLTRGLELTGLDDELGVGSLLTFTQKFEGTPYGVEWATAERVAHLPMINDITAPTGLPEVQLEINGHRVTFILDSGGDRLYLDEGLADQLGIKVVTKRKSRYAYTGGETVEEPLGVADRVRMGEVTLRNVPAGRERHSGILDI